jgi:DNA polymerase-3 subunit epsilon
VFPGLTSYKLGQLSGQLGIPFKSRAHRAEADAELAAEVLIHIGRHLGASYGLGRIEPALLASLNKLSAAKAPVYLGKYAAGQAAENKASQAS